MEQETPTHQQTPKHHQVNWTVIIIIALIIVGILGLLYIQSIDEKNRIEKQKVESSVQLEKDKLEADKVEKESAANAEKQAETDRQTALDGCFSEAYSIYSINWNSACSIVHDANEKGYSDCVNTMAYYYSSITETRTACRKIWEFTPLVECKLPISRSTKLDQDRKDAREECMRRYSK